MENRVYMENKDNFWRDLLVKIVLILLFIFLLIWLFPMPKLDTFYDRIFAENIKMMEEAAKDYFTIQRLPKEIGEKTKITLREMIENKMILPFLDKDGNACNFDNSYVEVVRDKTEYVFKINLSCPSKTDYIITYVGCYDVCEDEKCKEEELEKILEYQFSRKTTKNVIDKYNCPQGYTVKGSSCIKESSIIDKIPANITCPAGYDYNNISDKCEKVVSKTTDANPICPEGYGYNENSNSCLKYVTLDKNPTPICLTGTYDSITGKCKIPTSDSYTAKRECPSGTYNSSTGKCDVISSSTYMASISCANGTYDSITGKCKIIADDSYNATPIYTTTGARTYSAEPKYTTTTLTMAATESKSWSCQVFEYSSLIGNASSELYTRTYIGPEPRYVCSTGTSCLKLFYKYNECSAVIIGSCSNTSYTYSRTSRICTKQSTYISSYSCPSGGTLSGTTCNIAGTQTISSYSCPNGGDISGSRCIKTSTSYANPKYSCPSGGDLVGTTCALSETTSINPIYSCPGGGDLAGTVCNVSGTSTSNPTLKCNYGLLLGGVCKVTSIDIKTPTYSCNGVLSGNKCITTSILRENIDYTCKEGYDRAGTMCVKTTSSSSIIDATPVYKESTYTEYKWSRSETLKGWTRTGKTREVLVKSKEIIEDKKYTK